MTTERTPDQMWPEHAGHEVLYSEHGRTDYELVSLELVYTDADGDQEWSANQYRAEPINGDVQDTEVWCRTCGTPLSTWIAKEEP
jgi:hypothetical protein